MKPARVERPVILAVPVAVRLARVRFPEIRALPCREKRLEGVEVPMPTLEFEVSSESKEFPIFQALTADAKEVEAETLKFKKLEPKKMEPEPVCKVPRTLKLFSMVEVPVPPT